MNQYVHLLSLENEPDPRSPMTPGCLGPITILFNWRKEKQVVRLIQYKKQIFPALQKRLCKKSQPTVQAFQMVTLQNTKHKFYRILSVRKSILSKNTLSHGKGPKRKIHGTRRVHDQKKLKEFKPDSSQHQEIISSLPL